MEEIPKDHAIRLKTALARLEPAMVFLGGPQVKCHDCGGYFQRHNGSSDACDMDSGPCACGGWHSGEHVCPICKEK